MNNKLVFLMFTFLSLLGCSSNNISKETSSKPKLSKTNTMDERHVLYLKGVELEKAGQFKKAVELYKKSAKQGHYMAQIDLGHKYFNGQGVEQNYSKAAYWFEKSVNHSYDPVALYNLGQMYRQGLGVPKNFTKTMTFYIDSAKQDYTSSQYMLGYIYGEGLGVTKNKIKAINYYTDAAKKGHADAQNNLGLIYKDKSNYKKARQLFKQSANQGNKNAIANLARLEKLNIRGL